MVLNSPCFTVKSWLVQDQTVPGKDKSSLLIVDSLLKTIMFSIHLVVYNEKLAIPEQMATGKGTSNPLMAGSLPKTTKPTRTIDQAAGGKLRDKNAEESWALLKDLALYDNESWNDPRDFAKPIKEISLPEDIPSTSDLRLIELENQVQRLMEAHLAPKSPVQVNKTTSS
ncbi:hypothetical protein Tco_0870833 [Tanacetum coccineum]